MSKSFKRFRDEYNDDGSYDKEVKMKWRKNQRKQKEQEKNKLIGDDSEGQTAQDRYK